MTHTRRSTLCSVHADSLGGHQRMVEPVLPAGRDFAGYRGAPPQVRWPGGARLAVSVVVNVEEGAELSIGMGDESNESIYEATERVDGARDLCMESHYE